MKHLESFDSFIQRNKDSELVDNDTLKIHAKELKEEQKYPDVQNALSNAQI